MSYIAYFGSRLLQAIVTIFGVALISFTALYLSPGDAADVFAASAGGSDAAYVDALREQLGVNLPYIQQFSRFLYGVATFDLGYSLPLNMPVWDALASRIGPTLVLMVAAIAVSLILGTALGTIAARWRQTAVDGLISSVALLGYAMPMFWLSLLLILLFTVNLGWLPSSGMRTIGAPRGGIAGALDVARHAVMPVTALALYYTAIFTRLMRASVLDVSSLDFVRTARSKGMSEARVYRRHIARNALLPIFTMLGLQVSSLLGGSVVVETIFGWPGIGRLTFDAIFARDIPLLLGILMISSICVVATNLLVDLGYMVVDPRIKIRK